MFEENVLYKSRIFKEAYKIYQGGFLKVKETTNSSIIYEVEDLNSKKIHLVTLKYDFTAKTASIDCTCTIQALKSKHKPLCSHIVACIMHAGFQIGRKQRGVSER